MSLPLDKNFIPNKVASELSGYNSDYIARLCREGKIEGTQIGRAWFVNRESLEKFMQQQGERKKELARELSAAREREYQARQGATQIPVEVKEVPFTAANLIPAPILFTQPEVRKIAVRPSVSPVPGPHLRHIAPALRGGFATALTALVLLGSVYAAQSGLVNRFATNLIASAVDVRAGQAELPDQAVRAVYRVGDAFTSATVAITTGAPRAYQAGVLALVATPSDAAAAVATAPKAPDQSIGPMLARATYRSVTGFVQHGLDRLALLFGFKSNLAVLPFESASTLHPSTNLPAPDIREDGSVVYGPTYRQSITTIVQGVSSDYVDSYVASYVTNALAGLRQQIGADVLDSNAVTRRGRTGSGSSNTSFSGFDSIAITNSTFTGSSITTSALTVSGSALFTGTTTISGPLVIGGLNGVTECLHVDADGVVSGTGSDCGSGGGSGITGLRAQYSSLQTGATQTFATSSDANLTLTITSSGNTHTFTPSWTGVLSVLRGGTGLSTIGANQLLIGNSSGTGYTSVATSSLGLSTSDISEGSNLYYTLARFASALAGTTTDALAEGVLNKYYTDARARSAFSATATGLSYSSTTGVLGLASGYEIPLLASTSNWNSFYATPSTRIAAGTNLSWSGNTLNGPSDSFIRGLLFATSPLAYDNTTGTFSIAQASSTGGGYLTATDWTTFNNKIASTSLSATYPLAYNSATGVFSTAFGTTTSNTWGGTQTFTNTPILGTLSGLVGANAGGLYQIATSTNFVTALTGTANQIAVSAPTGAVALSLPNYVIFPGSFFAANASTTNATTTSFGLNAETFTDLTGTGLQNIGGALTLNATGDWTGTFDGQDGSYYLDRANHTGTQLAATISDFDSAVNSYVAASTTIAKAYTSNTFTNTNTFSGTLAIGTLNGPLQANNGVVSATTSIGVLYGGTGLTSAPTYGQLLVGNASSGYTLTATSSLGLGTVTSVNASGGTTGLSFTGGPITSSGTLTLSGTLAQANGGTGIASYSAGDILYADGSGNLTTLPVASNGLVLKLVGGIPSWQPDLTTGGGGGAGAWATTSDSLAIYPADTSNVVIVGASATSSLASILEVHGKSYFSNFVGIGTTSPFAMLSVAGNGFFSGNLTATNITATGTATINTLSLTNTLTVANGGTGATSFTAGQLVYGNGTAALTSVATSSLAISGPFSISGTLGALVGGSNTTITYSGLATTTSLSSSQLLVSNGGAGVYGVSTSTATLGLGLSGSLTGLGASNSLTIATSSLYTGTQGQVAYFSGTNAMVGTSTLFINTNGNVGVGTSTPWGQLSINPNGISGPAFAIGSSTGTSFVVTNGGRVGIGTASPTATLSIQGANASVGSTISALSLQGGTGGTGALGGTGGGATLTGGTGGTGSNVGGAGGSITFTGGDGGTGGSSGGHGGGIVLIGGAGGPGSASVAGEVALSGGDSGASLGRGGAVNIAAGFGTASNGLGGDILLTAGDGGAGSTATAGAFTFIGGSSGGAGGGFTFTGGNTSSANSAGGFTFTGGVASSSTANATGGAITLTGGAASSTVSSVGGGGITLTGGAGGTGSLTNGSGGNITLNGGAAGVAGGSVGNVLLATARGVVGVASTSPYALLSIHANNGATNNTLFAIGSSTASATSTLFSISNTGVITSAASATSTFTNGIAVTGGCVSVNGTCLGTGAGTVSSVNASGGTTGLSFTGGPITSSGTLTLSGTLTVANGGTGSTTLTGLLKGNGTGAILTAVAGTDYQVPITAGTGLSFSGTTLNSYWTLNGSNNLYNNNSGTLVGIGNASPAYTLDVGGFINTDQYSGYKQAGNTILYASSTLNSTLVGLDAGTTQLGQFTTAIGSGALQSNGNVTHNTAVGYQALNANTTGAQNTALGSLALTSNLTGASNVAVGYAADYFNFFATNTVAIGREAAAGAGNYGNQGSVSIGYRAGFSYADGSNFNTLIGNLAGSNISTGANNIILGADTDGSYSNLTTGSNNIQIGTNISLPNAAGSNQLNIGNLVYGTGLNGTAMQPSSGLLGIATSSPYAKLSIHANNGDTATTLFAIGSSTANATSTLFSVNNIGSTTLFRLTSQLLKTDSNGTIVGAVAGTDYLTSSTGITSITQNGGGTAQTGAITFATSSVTNNGVTIGLTITNSAGTFTFTPARSGTLTVAGGGTGVASQQTNGVTYYDGTNITSSANFTFGGANGQLSVPNNGWYSIGGNLLSYASSTNGATVFGLGAGGNNATTSATVRGTTAVGYQALQALTTGGQNTALGYQALTGNITGANNTAVGNSALSLATTTASDNVALGYQAGQWNIGTRGIAIGSGAALGNISTGYSSIGSIYIGYNAANSADNGSSYNTFIGYRSGTALTSGYGNILLGANPDFVNNITSGTNNIGIGYNIAYPSATASGQLNIGNLLFGSIPATTTASNLYPTTGAIGIATSSPFAKLSIHANNGSTATTLFAIGSSTASATTTLFSISNTGAITTSLASALLTTDANGVITATSSLGVLYGGTGLTTAPTYGQLLVGNAAGGYTLSATSSLGIAISDTTGTLALSRGGTATTTFYSGGVVYSDGTKLTQATGSGNSVFAWNNTTGSLGIGSTSPWAQISINPSGISGPAFAIGSSSATNFLVTNGGIVGIGTTSPQSNTKLTVQGSGLFSGHLAVGNNAAVDMNYSSYFGGSFTQNASLLVNDTFTNPSLQDIIGSGAIITLDPSADTNVFAVGGDFEVYTKPGSTKNFTNDITALYSGSSHFGTGELFGLYGIFNTVSNGSTSPAASGTTTNAYGIYTEYRQNAIGTTTNAYGVFVAATVNSGKAAAVTNNYGLFLGDQSAVGSVDSYNLYSAGANAKNYFQGLVGVGTTSPYAQLSVHANNGSTKTTLFAIGSSTASATTTLFSISNTGAITTSLASALLTTDANGVITATSTLGLKYGGTATTTFYSGGVVFSDGTKLTQSASTGDFYWDNTNKRLGLGTTSPQSILDLVGSSNSTSLTTFVGSRSLSITNTDTTNNNAEALTFRTNDANGLLTTASKIVGVNTSHTANAVSGDLAFLTRNAGTLAERLRITGAGFVGIGTTTPKGILGIQTATNAAAAFTVSNAIGSSTFQVDTLDNSDSIFSVATSTGSTYFYVGASGNIGVGTTTPGAALDVYNGALCVDDNSPTCQNAARTAGTIYAVSTSITGIDLAERYPTKDQSLSAAEIVAFDPANPVFVKRAGEGSSSFLGVVSTKPGIVLGGFNDSLYKNEKNVPIALSGRVPVSVNMEGGAISVGDYITISSTPGVGKKATASGQTIGVALENASANGTIQVYIKPEYTFIGTQFAIDPATGNIGIGTQTPTHKLEVAGDAYVNNLLSADSFHAFGAGTSTLPFLVANGFDLGGQYIRSFTGTGLDLTNGILSIASSSLTSNLFANGGNAFGTTTVIGTRDGQDLALMTASTTRLTITAAGQIGIGTNAPTHTVEVVGDVAAISFVNTSTRTAKQDISYLSDEDTDSILAELQNLRVAQYHYKIENPSNPLRLGLIAEEAPAEVLAIDGKGVDIYKLATFTLAGVQALAGKVDTLETKVADIDARLAALQGLSLTASSTAASADVGGANGLAAAFESFGAVIRNGFAQFQTLVAHQFVASKDADGTSVAGEGSIASTTSSTLIENKLVRASSKIFITFNGPVDGGWYITDKKDGSFKVVLKSNPTEDVTFDYFFIQTEAGLAAADTAAPAAGTGAAPIVTLSGATPIYVPVGGTYTDPGATAHDAAGNTLTYTIQVNGTTVAAPTLDTTHEATYTLTYTAFDAKGNFATATRTVIVANPGGEGSADSVAAPAQGGDSAPVATLAPESAPEPAPAPEPDPAVPVASDALAPATGG